VSALTDKTGAPSLANFERLFTDPTLLAPLRISLTVATCVAAYLLWSRRRSPGLSRALTCRRANSFER
jgi:hypothetical protein